METAEYYEKKEQCLSDIAEALPRYKAKLDEIQNLIKYLKDYDSKTF